MGAFHAYDIRGIYGVDFNRETAYKIGYFIPKLLGTDRVLVGRDCRVTSPEVHDAVVEGLTDAGADVFDAGLSSTPMIYFGTANYSFKASVQITASHNPREHNGMKVSTTDGAAVGYDAGLKKIEQWILDGVPTPPAERKGTVSPMDIKKDYVDFLMKFKGDYSKLNLAMDLSNGMANLFARTIFGDAPAYINEGLDGNFPAHEPNPLLPENTEQIRALVRKTGADAGVIWDGDADRVMFIDENGSFIQPDIIIGVLGHYYLKERGLCGYVLQDIRSSKAIGEHLEPMGAKMATWRVGRAYAAAKLREIDGVFGGELAGHYYFRDFFYSDSGMLAAMLVLRVVASLKKEGRTFSSLVREIATYQNSGEINFKIEKKQEAMDAVLAHFKEQETPSALMDFDGYRAEFPQWWFNIRPSNTEPLLRFLCEASSAELLKAKVAEVQDILEKNFGARRV